MRTTLLSLLSVALLALPRNAPAAGGLAFMGHLKNNAAGVSGLNGVLAVTVSPDGRSVYAASDVGSSVSVFRREAGSGNLWFVERQLDNTAGVDGLDHVRAIAVSPDGANVYAAGEQDDALAVFARDLSTGALTFVQIQRNGVGGVTGLNGPRCLAVSPDGAEVYAASGGDNALVVFARAADGLLTYVGQYQDGTNGVNGLRGPEALAFGPDGRHLYVAASGDNSVAVFARDPADGSLTYVDRFQHSTTVPDGLDGVKSVAVAADDQTIYAGGKLDDAVATLHRDPGTGKLSFVGQVRDTVAGVDGLDAVEGLALSPDGRYLYAVASNDNAIATFLRDATTGELTFVHAQKDGAGTIGSLVGAKAVALSPDGESVYVAATGSASVNVFDTRCGDGTLDAGEQCDDGNAVAGDGCSPGCRIECATAADCNDNDRCTEEVCRAGECAMPECGLKGAVCEIGRAIPAIQGVAECLPLQRPLGRTIRVHLASARTAVLLVQHPPPPPVNKHGKPKKVKKVSMKKLSSQVGKILATVEVKAGKLEQQNAISADCLAAVKAATEALSSDVGISLQRKGLCVP